MKLENVPIADIVDNPWRNRRLFPLDKQHVDDVTTSIETNTFFQNVVGRWFNSKLELAAGHVRVEFGRRAGMKTVPVNVMQMDDDQMLRLMVDENALQSGANPGAIMNEVAAVTRRLIEGVGGDERSVHDPIKQAFGDQHAIDTVRGKIRKRLADNDADVPIGLHTIRRYLGRGDEDKAHRSIRQIRDAIANLKDTGLYDSIIDDAMMVLPSSSEPPLKTATSTAVIKSKATSKSKPRKPILDERCASVFANDAQFAAFKQTVLTEAGRRFIAVDQQYEIAKAIFANAKKKHVGVPYIKSYVGGFIRDATKAQKGLDEKEKQRLYREQRDQEVRAEVIKLEAAYRSVISYSGKIAKLYEEYPVSPFWGDLGGKARKCMHACEFVMKTIK